MGILHNIIGHDKQKNILRNLISNKRVPHLMLFSGQEGIGKYHTAMEFARTLQCRETEDYCGHCEICRQSFDILTISRDGKNIKIDQLRELKSLSEEKPYKADRKVFIIRDAEYMNEESMNSALRTFEEPCSHVLIILVCNNKTKLLPTIISRCFQLDFFPLKSAEIKSVLMEKLKFSPEEAEKYLKITDRTLEFVPFLGSDFFEGLYSGGDYYMFRGLLENCSILYISKVLDTVHNNSKVLFLKLFILYMGKNIAVLSNLLGKKYGIVISLLICSLENYEAYNLNENIFIESVLLRLKEVLNN